MVEEFTVDELAYAMSIVIQRRGYIDLTEFNLLMMPTSIADVAEDIFTALRELKDDGA